MKNIHWERSICWFGEIKNVPENKDNDVTGNRSCLRNKETKSTLIFVFQKIALGT